MKPARYHRMSRRSHNRSQSHQGHCHRQSYCHHHTYCHHRFCHMLEALCPCGAGWLTCGRLAIGLLTFLRIFPVKLTILSARVLVTLGRPINNRPQVKQPAPQLHLQLQLLLHMQPQLQAPAKEVQL
jgi:hypothetical protein